MKRVIVCLVIIACVALVTWGIRVDPLAAQQLLQTAVSPPAKEATPITIDYPVEGSIFPPEFPAPTFLWRNADANTTTWLITVTFSDHSVGIRVKSFGERLSIGEIDPRCVAATNELPRLTPQQAAAHTWTPDAITWAAIKQHSMERVATVTITGFNHGNPNRPVSQGSTTIRTSRDPVGAPIFYRDVPLMPSESQEGVIKPLAANAVPLIAWRLRNVAEARSRLLMEGLHTSANCHSFSLDGKTLGMDVDGPGNDKGLYALASVKPQMSIRNEDVIKWSTFRGPLGGQLRVGFMSQVSPDGRYVVTTINDPGRENRERLEDLRGRYYVTNFKDYRFLQVFYPTRGILAWYSRATGLLKPLPGADDPRYVQTDGVWSPDGKSLIFARAEAKNPYPKDGIVAEYANDPKETQIKYDLYRIPFNEGKGGVPEPIAGASQNGMSNNFPKVSPDGRWIVFVKCSNGQLMRPDSQLFIVPLQGGPARRMKCNTPLMNSWHSFSPNGRWLVFSSKSRSPYTQMFLTHLDNQGQDSPAILIENATAANRAVNIPEFVNIPADGLLKIDAPATESYRLTDLATELEEKGREEDAIAALKEAVALNPEDASTQNNLGVALAKTGRLGEGIPHFDRALALNPDSAEIHNSFGAALASLALKPGSTEQNNTLGLSMTGQGKAEEAITHFKKAIAIAPEFVNAHENLGNAYYFLQGKALDALAQWRQVLLLEPNRVPVLTRMAWVLATSPEASVRNGTEAVKLAERAAQLSGRREPSILDALGAAYAEAGRYPEAVQTALRALDLSRQQKNSGLAAAISSRIALYEARTPAREKP